MSDDQHVQQVQHLQPRPEDPEASPYEPIRVSAQPRPDGATSFKVELVTGPVALPRHECSAPAVEPTPAADSGPLRIARGGALVRTPAGRLIDLSSRRPLQRLVLELAQRRAESGWLVPHDDLIAVGWPGERFTRDAGRNRLRVAIYELRNLGLRDYMTSSRAGHRFISNIEWADLRTIAS